MDPADVEGAERATLLPLSALCGLRGRAGASPPPPFFFFPLRFFFSFSSTPGSTC